jgi:glycosyltransferase involved in cell wall biosynthesis
MKRIGVFLTAGPSGGGMFQYSLAVLSALLELPQNEYTLVAAYTDPAWTKIIPTEVERLPLRLGRTLSTTAAVWTALGLPHKLWLRCAPLFFSAVREVVNENCDLWIFPRQDIWSSRFPVPVLAAVHDLMHRYEPHFPEAGGLVRGRYRQRYMQELIECSMGILVDSEVGKQQVLESFAADSGKVFILPYVPPAHIYETRVSSEFNLKYRLPGKFLFYPAEFWPHKNHLRLIDAIARVRASCGDIHLILAGSFGKEYSRVRSHVEKLGLQDHVHFAGYLPEADMPEFYRRARALVFPTFFGPTNIPPLEAFALACPVAASRIYGMPEQLGDAALLFDPRSEEQMAECIQRLWTDDHLCQQLSLNGLRRAQLWGPAQFASAFRAVIDRLARARVVARSSSDSVAVPSFSGRSDATSSVIPPV